MKTDLNVWEKIFGVNGMFHQAGDWHSDARYLATFYITCHEDLYPRINEDHCNERL